MNFPAIDRTGTHSVKWDECLRKFGTDDLLPLWVADMDIAAPECVQKRLQERANHPIYGYTVYPDEYYQAIIGRMQHSFDWSISQEMIVPDYGVVPSIYSAIASLSKVGDGVIVQTPIYPPFLSSVKHLGRKLLDNTLVYENGRYRIDFEDLEEKAKSAKLLLFCSPHNPTGRAWERWELKKIVTICQKHNLLIISDEIHADMIYSKPHIPIATLAPDMTVTLNAPSKSFNIAGLNTSYTIIPNEQLRRRYTVHQKKTGHSNGNVFGIEALITAYSEGREWLDNAKSYFQGNMAFVNAFLEKYQLPIKATPTEATFLMWLDCRAMGLSDQALADFFIHQAKLGLNRGGEFGQAGEGFMRLNVGTSREVLEVAMERLLRAFYE